MKVFNFFAHVFSIFAFLTMGSLLMIVALHILSVDDAILRVQQIYESPWKSIQAGLIGLLFITVGLTFTRMLLKKGREAEAVIYQTERGPVLVSVEAIEDAAKKVLKKFHLVKEWRIKTLIHSKDVEIRLRIILWAGGNVPELLTEVQTDVARKVQKLLGSENRIEVSCDVKRIEDHEPDYPVSEERDRPRVINI